MVQDHQNPDIAFLGASVVEEMDGRWFGNSRDEDLNRLDKLFNKNFKKGEGAELDAIALGIAGDTVRHCTIILPFFSKRLISLRVPRCCGDS